MHDDGPADGLPDLTAIETDLEAVDGALARLDDGAYGTCVVCGAVIGDSDLEVMWSGDRCVAHSGMIPARHEQSDQTA